VRDSSLSACAQAIMAAEVGHLDLAYDYLAEAALMDLRDLEHNILDGLHVASLGGALLAVYAALGGMRDCGGRVSFSPRLPEGLDRAAFRVALEGRCLRVEIGRDEASYSVRDGDSSMTISHWGEPVDIEPGAVITRPVARAPSLSRPSQPRGREPRRRNGAS
jgi:alpha,alpha-trehalose phosphorylase